MSGQELIALIDELVAAQEAGDESAVAKLQAKIAEAVGVGD